MNPIVVGWYYKKTLKTDMNDPQTASQTSCYLFLLTVFSISPLYLKLGTISCLWINSWKCQLMVGLVPIQWQRESPIWGVAKKEILLSANSSIVIEHVCEKSMAAEQLNNVTAQLWSSMTMKYHGYEETLQGASPEERWSWGKVVLLCSFLFYLLQTTLFFPALFCTSLVWYALPGLLCSIPSCSSPLRFLQCFGFGFCLW